MNKEILHQIIECLAIIAENPNVYSKSLSDEIIKLGGMIEEETNEKEST